MPLHSFTSILECTASEPRLSVCLIAKDEEDVLPRCLRSVQEVADEIILVDTGSTDKTVEIARSMGAKVFHYQWRNDFAAARNYAIEQASGDWILQIDADEELYQPDTAHLRELIRREDIDAIYVIIRNFFPSPAVQTDEPVPNPMSHPHSVNHYPRLFRNKPEIRYSGAIHEGIKVVDCLLVSDISIFHYGYAQKGAASQRRFQRNREMTLRNLERNPNDPIAHYYAATTCLTAGLYEEAEQHLLKMLPLAHPDNEPQEHFYLMALCHLATLAMLRNDYQAEEHYAREATELDPGYLDPWLRLGESCFFQDKLDDAEKALNRYRELLHELSSTLKPTKYTLYLADEEHYACFILGRIAWLKGNRDGARHFYERSIELRELFWGAHYFLGILYARENDPRAREHLERARELNPDIDVEQALAQTGDDSHGPPASQAIPAAAPVLASSGHSTPKLPEAVRLQAQAHALVKQNDLAGAAEKLALAIQAEPQAAVLHNDLGWVMYQSGQHGKAEQSWNKAYELDPDNLAVVRNLADYSFEVRRLDAAEHFYSLLVERLGEDAPVEVLDGLADTYMEQGRYAEAADLYERILYALPSAKAVQAKLDAARKRQTTNLG